MTHTYPEIKPADIREGDLVRWEHSDSDDACEWRQTGRGRAEHRLGTYYLISRPTPPVELPETPTWGWLTYRGTDYPFAIPTVEFGEWKARTDRATVLDVHGSTSVPTAWVTAFTPATAVPTESLDALRKTLSTVKGAVERRGDIETFLADVDRANS